MGFRWVSVRQSEHMKLVSIATEQLVVTGETRLCSVAPRRAADDRVPGAQLGGRGKGIDAKEVASLPRGYRPVQRFCARTTPLDTCTASREGHKKAAKKVDAHRTRVLLLNNATGSYQLPAAAQHLTLPGVARRDYRTTLRSGGIA